MPTQSTLIATLSQAERDRLSPFVEEVNLAKGQTLLEIWEPIDYVWFPHDAVTSTLVDTPEGATIEVGLMGLEGLIGLSLLLGNDRSSATVIAQVPGRAARMQANHFVSQVIKARGELYQSLLRYTDAFMAMVAQTAACNSLHGIDERLARWLLMTHDRVDRETIPLTQEFLSYMLGVRRSSVSVAASSLQLRGIIEYRRGEVRILDRPQLHAAACSCYDIVRKIMNQRDRSKGGLTSSRAHRTS